MEYIQTDFSKELSELLLRHKKRIEADKAGIYAIDDEFGERVIIARSSSGSEDWRDKLIFLRG